MVTVLGNWLPLSVLTWIVMMAVYHGVGFAFEWCDRTGHLRRFKVRDIDRLSYGALLPRVLRNQLFILLPAMILLQATGLAFVGRAHVGVLHFIVAVGAMGVGHDVVQYVFHRYVLHNPRWIRKLGHSIHHATGASKAISACYMSPVDFFLEIVLPYLVPLVCVAAGADVLFQLVVAGLGALGGLYEHSGYDFARAFERRDTEKPGWRRVLGGLVSSQAHGEHHRRSSVSFSDGFGSPGLCDTLLGTRWDKVDDGSLPGRVPAE